jgi:hypothetical protein
LSSRAHHTDYDDATTARCERALVTLLGDLGPWSERIYLAGGLAPRYLIGRLPEGARAHVGTTDIDLIIGLALGDETPETYRTLQNNLEKSGFSQSEPSFRWTRDVEGVKVIVEFLCETDQETSGASSARRANTPAPSSARSTCKARSSHATTSSSERSKASGSTAAATRASASAWRTLPTAAQRAGSPSRRAHPRRILRVLGSRPVRPDVHPGPSVKVVARSGLDKPD